jgi:ribonuclease E
MGHKGARLTNLINLSGRYVVLDPKVDKPSVSRRLSDSERDRLKDIARELTAEFDLGGFGMIVRTAAEGASKEEIAVDIERLLGVWADIQESTPKGAAPRMIYEEPPLVIRVIREHFTRTFAGGCYRHASTTGGYVPGNHRSDLVSQVAQYDEGSRSSSIPVEDSSARPWIAV